MSRNSLKPNKKTMKNALKTLIFGLLAVVFAGTFVSCSEDSDPEPKKIEKTDLELVKDGIIGTWELQSIVVTHGDVTQTFNGGCDESGYTQAIKANLEDIDFRFKTDGTVDQILICQDKIYTEKYNVVEKNKKIIITTDNGWEFELMTPVKDLNKKSIQVNSLYRMQNVDKVVYTFTIK